MATSVITHLLDDLDGGQATNTVPFSWGGVQYEIDLSDKNAAAFEKAISRYVEAARRVGGRSGVGRSRKAETPAKAGRSAKGKAKSKASAQTVDTAAVREWAAQNGYEVSARGRLSSAIVDAYNAAS